MLPSHMKYIALAALSASMATACATAQPPAALPPAAPESDAASRQISLFSFEETNKRLQSAIETRGLTLFTTVDHAAGAARADLELAPTTLYIFGNPQGGTPLMQANPEMGLHLPLKALVYERDGTVQVTVTDIRDIAASLGVSEPAVVLDKVSGALAAIQAEATGN